MDFFFTNPPSTHVNTKVFYCLGSSWQSWHRPAGASMVFIMAVGGGGGGAGGNSSGSAAGLGDGGGSGAIARLLIPAALLPDCLFIQAGAGGAGGFSTPPTSTNGGDGGRSFVSAVSGSTTAANLVLVSGATAAQGGRAPNAGSAGETIATAASAVLSTGGIWTAVAGGAGAHSDGTLSVTALANSIVCGGAAGPTEVANAAGGDITGAGRLPTVPGGAAGPGAGQGKHGFARWFPMLFTGGSGGGACIGGGGGGAGGNGGNGAYGCGGGGCGGSDTDAHAATLIGGRGGDGFVIIASW